MKPQALLEPSFVEPIRLVVWDLDETFWSGTLSEGGVQHFIQAHHDLVINLSHRGIMNAICSKNDFAPVQTIMEKLGLWEYFIFPSIAWSAKGARVRSIVELCQLRPQTVLFIDDNPSNLAEVAEAIPGIITAGVEFIPSIATHQMFRGKDDSALTRLAQYKTLEKKQTDQATAGADNVAFLRNSQIKVEFEYDVEPHIDRVIELINRTNQLNFTKVRLPAEAAAAREEILQQIRSYENQAALINVSDIYGDYGFCGFYLKGLDAPSIPGALHHFCFSCRILGMGVEQFVYQRLARPPIEVVGEVVSGLNFPIVDWINQSSLTATATTRAHKLQKYVEIRMRGGCETAALSHYFKMDGKETTIETSYLDGIFGAMMDASTHLLNALTLPPHVTEIFQNLSFPPDVMQTRFFNSTRERTLHIFTPWSDIHFPRYTHKTLGFSVHVLLAESLIWTGPHAPGDLAAWSDVELQDHAAQKRWSNQDTLRLFSIVRELRKNYLYSGIIPEHEVKSNINFICSKMPENSDIVFILPTRYMPSGECVWRSQKYIEWYHEVLAGRPQCLLIEIDDFVKAPSERHAIGDHFDRIVYQRVALEILKRCDEGL